jgi:hypothetical protein
MLRRTVKFVAVVALVALPSMAQAQLSCVGAPSCSLLPTATLTIPTIVRMQVPSLAVTLNGASVTDLSGGAAVVPGSYGDVNVRANSGWTLTLAANAANWAYTGAALDASRAAGTLQYSVNSGAFASVSQTAATLATSTAASNSTNVNVQFQAQIPADYADPANRPGSYALGLTLTLSAP